MGGNTIAILDGRQFPTDKVQEIAIKILSEEHVYADEAGILYPGEEGRDLDARIVGRASGKFLSACGGFTQVLGKVLATTNWGEKFRLEVQNGGTVMLGTHECTTPIHILCEGKGITTETDMTNFLEEIYEQGIEPLVLCGVKLFRVGRFLVIHADELRMTLSNACIESLDDVSRRKIMDIQREFSSLFGHPAMDLAIYDNHPAREGNDFRVVFPHCIEKGVIEPSCGTGSVAVCVAAFQGYGGFIPVEGESPIPITLRLESGGGPSLGGPDISVVKMIIQKGVAKRAVFSHSNVEITCEGNVYFRLSK